LKEACSFTVRDLRRGIAAAFYSKQLIMVSIGCHPSLVIVAVDVVRSRENHYALTTSFAPMRLLLLCVPQSSFVINPKPFMADLVGKRVRVKLKWGMEYQGDLVSTDAYMNLQLENSEEFVDGKYAGTLGEILIRCNNVLYIKAADVEAEQAGPAGEEGAAGMEE
jgi:small nuclear ribonucleoprotein F